LPVCPRKAALVHRITLDTNCLIDLEQGNARGDVVRELVTRHRAGQVELRIPSVMASERLQGGAVVEHFDGFTQRLGQLGVADLPLIQPIAYYGIAFYGQGYWANDEMVALERKIHEVLHPEVAFGYAEYCRVTGVDPDAKPIDKKW